MSPQIDISGADSKLSCDKIAGQSGSVITVQSGHNLAGSGSGLTALNATELTSGTVPDNRFPATLPAVSGANLTGITTGSWEYMSTSTTGSTRAFNNVMSFYNASPNWPAYMFVMDMAMDNSGGGLGIRLYNASNTLVTSGYQWNCAVLNSNASTWTIGNNNSDDYIKCSTNPCNAIPLWASVLVRFANGRTMVHADCTWIHTQGSSYYGRSVAGGLLFNSSESSGIQFSMHSGVFQGGNIFMYRLNKS